MRTQRGFDHAENFCPVSLRCPSRGSRPDLADDDPFFISHHGKRPVNRHTLQALKCAWKNLGRRTEPPETVGTLDAALF